jgi:hypothetical protein
MASCDQNFDRINTDPTAPTEVDPQFLLTNILWNVANNNTVDGWNAGNFLGQLTARYDFNEIDRWDIRTNTELWNKSYLLLNDIKSLEELSGGNQSYKGIALIMRAYLGATLTDLWGDVPYFDAIKGLDEGNFTPKYDSQEDIYTAENGILDNLETAADLLTQNLNGLPISGDIMYGGNIDQWIRLANSLRFRYLMRISSQVDVSQEMQSLVAEGMMFRNNGDNATIPYLSTAPNQWFVYTIRLGDYSDVGMSLTIEEKLKEFDDPRLQHFFKPTPGSVDFSTQVYAGIPNGLGPESRSNWDKANYSNGGDVFRDAPDAVNAMIMTEAELQFLLAEAVNKGLINGSEKAYYQAGILSAFAYYDLEIPSDYLQRPGVSYSPTSGLELIMTQKWLANFNNGYEGWLDHRRTGYPILKTAVDNTNNDLLPVRYRYPNSEQALNKANYDAAVSRMGGDTHDAKGWWER